MLLFNHGCFLPKLAGPNAATATGPLPITIVSVLMNSPLK
jgi:hypothetical protein